MKVKFLLAIIILCCFTCWGQTKATKDTSQQINFKKQMIADDLENQVREIPFVSVRVFVRYKIASWLWENGKDETGRAEQLAVKAIEELYKHKTEISSFSSLSSDLFTLLETNAEEKAKKLSAKYNLTSEDDLNNADSLLNKKDGEKLATDKLLQSLTNQTELAPAAITLMSQLHSRKSPELLRILAAIVNFQETGKINFSADLLSSIAYHFQDSIVPNDLRIRFFGIVLNTARNAFQMPNSDVSSAYNLLNIVTPEIAKNAPDFLGEASALQNALSTRVSQKTKEARDKFERINNSNDKLDALISEAEKTENKIEKYRLYVQAAQLALKEEKLRLSVDLVEKTIEENSEGFPLAFRNQWHDQFLGNVVQQALKKDDVDSADYATKKIVDKLFLAETLRKTAIYYSEKQDFISAVDSFDKAFKLAANSDEAIKKVYSLIGLISTAQKIDKNRVSEVTARTAKAINAIPTLDNDDKPGTENYKNYIKSIMTINYNLLPVISNLAKENKLEATNFANQINRKEIKIITDYSLLINSLNSKKKGNTASAR